MLKTEILNCQSKANLDVKSLFGKITYLLEIYVRFWSSIAYLPLKFRFDTIDLFAIHEKSLDRALFLYIFIHEVRLSGVRASIIIVYIRKFYKM